MRRARAPMGMFATLATRTFGAAGALEPSMNYTLHCMGCHTPDGSEVKDRVPAIRTTLLPFSRFDAGPQVSRSGAGCCTVGAE